jgi:hypothetical protein
LLLFISVFMLYPLKKAGLRSKTLVSRGPRMGRQALTVPSSISSAPNIRFGDDTVCEVLWVEADDAFDARTGKAADPAEIR